MKNQIILVDVYKL